MMFYRTKKQKYFKFFFIIAILAICAGGLLYFIQKEKEAEKVEVTGPITTRGEETQPNQAPVTNNTTPVTKPKNQTTNRLNLAVPFTIQAPTGNWDEIHEETCEEASAIMAYSYFAGLKTEKLEPSYVESEISRLIDWQIKNQDGRYRDQNSAEVAKMIRDNYNLKTELVENITEEQIKNALKENKLVIIAAAGRLLGNPNFKYPGPLYHMLVVRGYNEDGLITNDPGTRKGMNYSYTYETIRNAQAEWVEETHTVDDSKKIAIIVSGN